MTFGLGNSFKSYCRDEASQLAPISLHEGWKVIMVPGRLAQILAILLPMFSKTSVQYITPGFKA